MIQSLSKIFRRARPSLASPVISIILVTFLAGGCAISGWQSPEPGESSAAVIAKLGAPYRRHQTPGGELLEYRAGTWGQLTYMAGFDRGDRLVSYEQVLTDRNFGAIQIGKATKSEVLHRVGSPAATSYLSLKQLEVWSYPYKQDGVWNSVMHVHFDGAGRVHSLEAGPDLRFDRDGRFPFFGMGGGI